MAFVLVFTCLHLLPQEHRLGLPVLHGLGDGQGDARAEQVGWEILLLPPRACTDIMTGTNHLLGRAHGGKYSLELKPLHKVLIWDD